MIFVIRTVNKRSEEELTALYDRLVHEANTGANNKVICLPSDCTFTCIDDYNRADVKVIFED